MQAAIVAALLILAGIGWLVSFIQESTAAARQRSDSLAKMKALGLSESDLLGLLHRVPSGYLSKPLYWAKRDAEAAIAGRGRRSRAEAVVALHQALGWDDQERQRSKRAAEEEQRRVAQLMALAATSGPPVRDQLVISDGDYARDNEVDRGFRKRYLLRLLALYGNACAVCGSRDNGLDLDHFFVPKSQGGNFVLTRQDGVRINNAVPMCESCNRSKGDRHWKTIGHSERLQFILGKNGEANQFVNEPAQTTPAGFRRRL